MRCGQCSVGQTTRDGEYSGNQSGLRRVNKADNESYKDDSLDDAYRDYMALFLAIGRHGDRRVVARSCFCRFAFCVGM